MRAVVQRVSRAEVRVDGELVGRIERGQCVFVGVGKNDDDAAATRLARKVLGLRIFEDHEGKMNWDVKASGGSILAVSQFTLFGDARQGKRPSFIEAMEPGRASVLFDRFCSACRQGGTSVETGRFQAHMEVALTNDGPVTILLDTEKTF